MTWKKVEAGTKKEQWNFDNPLNNLEKGASLEGCFLGFKTINTSFGERDVALIKDYKGVINAVYVTTALRTYLERVPLFHPVKITCVGIVKSPKTKRRYWDFEILYDDAQKCEE